MTIQMYDLCGAESDRRFSPFCWRTKFALAHKQVPFETIAWKFTDKDVLAAHGARTVPVIIDGDQKVSDSWAIAEYLEDTYPTGPSLFPNGRGEARFVKSWTEAVLTAGVAPLVIHDIYRHVDPADEAYFRESREGRFGKTLAEVQASRDDRVKGFRSALNPIRMTLAAQDWIAGDQPAFADHMVMAPFMWARNISDFRLLEDDDPINDWRDRMLDLYDGLGRKSSGYDW